jgi:hypothetical protein
LRKVKKLLVRHRTENYARKIIDKTQVKGEFFFSLKTKKKKTLKLWNLLVLEEMEKASNADRSV